jgi:hypothetical protein
MAEPLQKLPGIESRPLTSLEQQQDADNAWALKHYDELIQRYPGEYLVVWRKQVVAHGKKPEQLLRESETEQRPKEELVLIAFPDPFAEIPD